MSYQNILNMLLNNDGDMNILRPFVHSDNKSYYTANNGKTLAWNADATLLHEEWKMIDDTVAELVRKELPFVTSMQNAGLVKNIPNGFDIGILLSQKASSSGEAVQSMSGLQKSNGDRTVYEDDSVPLVITSSDFSFPYRELRMARRFGIPLETRRIKDATYAVAELIENSHLGNIAAQKFNGYDVAGVKVAGSTATKNDLTAPTAIAWTPATTYQEINTMIDILKTTHLQRGPFKVYMAAAWSKYMNLDYSSNYANKTLLMRLKEHSDIGSIEEIPLLSDAKFDVIILAPNEDFNRTVNGMAITTLQWFEQGGMDAHFKVMGIKVPQFRADYAGKTGAIYGSIS